MSKTFSLMAEIARWALILLGAFLFAYGFGFGRWDAAVLGLLFMLFAVAISLKLRIMELREKIK